MKGSIEEPFPILHRAMGEDGPAPSWGEVMSELIPIISRPLSSDDKQVLREVLRYEGRLRLTVTHELPHSLPPEEMLKSLAVQALARNR